MTEKQKYIGAFLDGYFSDKKLDFGINYYSMLNDAIDTAEKKWKKYQKLEFPKQNIIDEWLDKNHCPEIAKQVEQDALELFIEIQREKLSYVFNFYTQQELAEKLNITQWELLSKMKDNSFTSDELLSIEKICNEFKN
jgi:hypothetical protein